MFGFLLRIVMALFCYLTHFKMEWNIRGWAMTKFAHFWAYGVGIPTRWGDVVFSSL
jgi:hypothetical protein